MKRFGHYLGNIAGAVLALVMYSELEVLYFRPQRFDLGNIASSLRRLLR